MHYNVLRHVLQAGSNVIQDSGFCVYKWALFVFKQNHPMEALILSSEPQF